ncbi:uncharacterized protein ACIBXB_018912 isoform 1-T1 [Morphnus guianensis]
MQSTGLMQTLLLGCGDACKVAGCMEGGEDLTRDWAKPCCYTQLMKPLLSECRALHQTWGVFRNPAQQCWGWDCKWGRHRGPRMRVLGQSGWWDMQQPQTAPFSPRSPRHTTMCSRQDKDQCHRQERYTCQSSGGCHGSSGGCHSSGGSGCHSSGSGSGCHSSGSTGGCHSSGGSGGCHSSGSSGSCHSSSGSSCHEKPQVQCQQQQQQQQQVHQLPSQKLK